MDAEARNDVADLNFGFAIRAGDPLLNIPRNTVNLQLSKSISIGSMKLMLGGGVQHVGERLGATGTSFTLPDYTLARAFASLTIMPNVEVFADVTNLFDTTWYSNSFNDLWVQPGSPRAASVALRLRY